MFEGLRDWRIGNHRSELVQIDDCLFANLEALQTCVLTQPDELLAGTYARDTPTSFRAVIPESRHELRHQLRRTHRVSRYHRYVAHGAVGKEYPVRVEEEVLVVPQVEIREGIRTVALHQPACQPVLLGALPNLLPVRTEKQGHEVNQAQNRKYDK